MSLRTSLLPALSALDSILGPNVLDLRPTQIRIIQRVWPDRHRGMGVPTEVEIAVLPNWIKVRQVSQKEIASSGGRYELGDIMVGPIRPSFTDIHGNPGGFSEQELDPPAPILSGVQSEAIDTIYRCTLTSKDSTGIAGDYTLIEIRRDKPFRFMMLLRRLETTP